MSTETIGIAAAVLGALFSVAWLVLGARGVRSLGEIADALRDREGGG